MEPIVRRPDAVPFGKYKGQPIAKLVRDVDYAKWLIEQSWFKNHAIYSAVVSEINREHKTTIGVPKVYFITNEEFSRVKIGTSVHPNKRLRQVQTGNPERLSLYGTVIGDRVFEKEIHKELQSNRLNGEWFAFPSCKSRIDELLGREREVDTGKVYSLWEFRSITGLTEKQVELAEWLGSKAGVCRFGGAGFDKWTFLRACGGGIRGWVWRKIVDSGCLKEIGI